MGKYILKRLVYGLLSAVCVVIIVMVLIYSMLDRQVIFAGDPNYTHTASNGRVTYEQSRYQAFGYVDYVPYSDYVLGLERAGEIDSDTRSAAIAIGRTPDKDSETVTKYVEQFTGEYEAQGYDIVRLDADVKRNGQVKDGGQPVIFATRDRPLIKRVVSYFTKMFYIDNIHYVPEDTDIGKRGLTFTLYDPVYNPNGEHEVFSPAIIGNGTKYKYLFYFDNMFPWIHEHLLTINLGESYTVNRGVDVATTMTESQGDLVLSPITFPTGLQENSADDLHTATYAAGSLAANKVYQDRFTDEYTNVNTRKMGMSKLGYSFVIGIASVILSYIIGLPVGLLMALRKDKIIDKLGTIYIMFIIAVPSLAYIFLFRAIGGKLGLPNSFVMQESGNLLMYVLPVVSLALPSIADLMKWMRRYMIDQMNSDYVKFARSGGLSEGEIFRKHIWKNALIPIVHNIPGSVIFAMTGAIITERVYSVPGAGNLLTTAINKYDNGVIVGVTLFYAVLSVISIILGDVLMAMVDPRISFTTKDR